MSDRCILVISTIADVATDEVVRILSERGARFIRVNTEDFPFDSSVTIGFQNSGKVALSFRGKPVVHRAIWYRRVRTPARPEQMDIGIYDFCLRENRAALLGGLVTQQTRWMSSPDAVWKAEFKPYQLRAAQDVGFTIPRTIISNDPEAIRQAYGEFGRMIVKPVRSGHFWQDGKEHSVYTSEVTPAEIPFLDEARWTPSIYQELVPKKYDIRVTCVGDQLFTAAIHSQGDPAAVVDWRKTDDPHLPHSRIELPTAILGKLQMLMRQLNLQFGCIDLVLTPSGDYVFLEVNPSGQWLWLDDQLDLGISRAVADWLAAA